MTSPGLSAEQLAAVRRSGQDVCVVAGPGSGKTRVLVERFAWLIEEQGIDPARILAITFTEKAARVMKQRLVERFESVPSLRESVERAWVMTIDAFCARLLRENAVEAGLAPDFAVFEEAAANRLRREAAESALDDLFAEKPHDMRRLMEAIALSTSDTGRQADLAQSIMEIHESMRLAGLREFPVAMPQTGNLWPEALRLAAAVASEARWAEWQDWARRFASLPESPCGIEHFALASEFKPKYKGTTKQKQPNAIALEAVIRQLQAQWILEWNAGLPELLRAAAERLDENYKAAKRRQSAVDFADLCEHTIELLESDAGLRAGIAGRFEHVLMDELQDTNRLQWRLVSLLRRPDRFFAVGDINQSIYGFRHADRGVFQSYREELVAAGHAIDELKENYRSREEILQAVDSVLADAKGVERRVLIARRQPETTLPAIVECVAGIGDHAMEMEAELVASRIAFWHPHEGRDWGDFAILVRALKSAEPFEDALEKRGIPFLMSAGRTFLETQETRDILGLLAALVNPLDEIATAGVLRGPLVGWSDDQLLQAGSEGRLQEFTRLFGHWRQRAGYSPPDQVIARILDQCGYAASLRDRAKANVEKLLGWMRREYRARPRALAELLDDLEALRDAQAEAEAPPQRVSGAVNIMTVHAAKGLEFPVVFVSALHRQPNHGSSPLMFSKELGLGVKWRNPADGDELKDAVHEQLSEELKASEKSEEQRLLYVAMTRAEDRLVLSHAQGRRHDVFERIRKAFPDPSSEFAPDAPAAEADAPRREEVLMDAPLLTGQHDGAAAVTDVAVFAACPRKYFLARYVGLQPEPEGPGTGAIEMGLEAHRAMAGEPTESPEAQAWKREFDASDLGQRMARAGRVEREFDFQIAVEDVVLRGQIDAWFEESGELILLDYKTDRDESGAHEYALQLRLYALALQQYAGRIPDRAALCFLRTGRTIEINLGSDELQEAKGMVGKLAAAQDALAFPLKVGEQCRRCWFYGGLCPAKLEEGTEL